MSEPDKVERVRCHPSVVGALDEYVQQLNNWGRTVNHPRLLYKAELELVQAVLITAQFLCEHGVRDLNTNLPYCQRCAGERQTTHGIDCWRDPKHLRAEIERLKKMLDLEQTANRITENHNHFDCAVAMARKDAEIERLQNELVIIGDMAVTDWNDAVVGAVDRAVPQTPATYAEHRRAEIEQANKLRAENERLKTNNQILRDSLHRLEDRYDALNAENERLKLGPWPTAPVKSKTNGDF